MLGVVTEATLKLIPLPAARWTLLTAFADEVTAFQADPRLFSPAASSRRSVSFSTEPVSPARNGATGRTVFPGQAGRRSDSPGTGWNRGRARGEQVPTVLEWARAHAVAYKEAGNRAEAEELWSVRRKLFGRHVRTGRRQVERGYRDSHEEL
jgi:glycolate oxidase